MNLFVINDTDFIWAKNEEEASKHYDEEVQLEVESCVLLADETPIYVQQPYDGGEEIWWIKKHEDHVLLEETTVKKFFSVYCGDGEDPFIVYSTEW